MYMLQINITWVSPCVFLALCLSGKTFRRPTVSLPQVLLSVLLRHTSHSRFSNPRDCPFGKEKKDGERRRVCPLRIRKFVLLTVSHQHQEKC